MMSWSRIAPPARMHRRVVVTGIGLVTPLGVGMPRTWSRICLGESGVRGSVDGGVPVASVPRGNGFGEWDPTHHIPRAETRTMSTDFIAFAVAAAGEALFDAGLLPKSLHIERSNNEGGTVVALGNVANGAALGIDGCIGPYAAARAGVALGSGIGAVEEIGAAALALSKGQKLSPFFVPKILLNMASGSVAMRFGLRGPNTAASTACATGAHSIGEAFRAVQNGTADVMVAGGTEAAIGPISIAGFSRARALAARGGSGGDDSASRPFDTKRDGFVLGEGAGVIVLESEQAARARGARIYAEIRGFGASADAYHVTSPREDGSGAAACMKAALADGGLLASDVGYVNAHATGTGVGDLAEALGIASVWSESTGGKIRVASNKGNLGHLLGAAGAVEAALTMLALYHRTLPVTRNLTQLDPQIDLLCESHGGGGPLIMLGRNGEKNALILGGNNDSESSEAVVVKAAISNSFGFGGTNASILITTGDF